MRAAYDWVLLCSVCSRQCSAPKPACGAYPAAHAPVGQKKQFAIPLPQPEREKLNAIEQALLNGGDVSKVL